MLKDKITGFNVPQAVAPTDSPTFAGVTVSGLTASKPVGTDANKALVSLTTTGSGAVALATSPALVTPALGTPTAGVLTSCTGLPAGGASFTATDKLLGRATAEAGVGEEVACTAAGRALLDDADASTQRATLGLGTIATQAANNVSISGGAVTGITDLIVADGGTGVSTLAIGGLLTGNAANAVQVLDPGATTTVLVGGGAGTAPVWTTATGSGAPVRETSPTLVTPALGTPASGTLTNCTGLPQAAAVGLTTADSPVFATVKLSGLTDLKVPKHVADDTGLADTTITVSAANEVTNASQPAFFAYNSAVDSDVTGDNTVFTVIFDTEVFDQNADFDGTSTFTAPVTGKYRFSANICFIGIASIHVYFLIRLVTSNRNYAGQNLVFTTASNVTILPLSMDILADMDAGDTAQVTAMVPDQTKVIDIQGDASMQTRFCGELVC